MIEPTNTDMFGRPYATDEQVKKLLDTLRPISKETDTGRRRITAHLCKLAVDVATYIPVRHGQWRDTYIGRSSYMCVAISMLTRADLSEEQETELRQYILIARGYISEDMLGDCTTMRSYIHKECFRVHIVDRLHEVVYPEYYYFLGFIARTLRTPVPPESTRLLRIMRAGQRLKAKYLIARKERV